MLQSRLVARVAEVGRRRLRALGALGAPGALGLAAALGTALVLPAPALAYDAATTLAGLTEQAALTSRLHRRLIDRMGCSLGLFEPLRLDVDKLSPEQARSLHVRLQALDDGQGYAPESLARQAGQSHPARRQHVLGWLAAGSVIESVPAARERHHFFEPRSGRGLFRPPGQTAVSAAVQSVSDGMASARQLLAGAAVDGTGVAAPDWINDPGNELSVTTFMNAYEQAVVQKLPADRQSALASAMLAAGGVLGVLEQMGDPAHVRNDLADLIDGGYQRYVTEHYGRAGVPVPGSVPVEALAPVRLRDLFTVEGGFGLADRTARRYFSSGSLPGTELGDVPALAGKPPLGGAPRVDESGRPVAEINAPPGWPPQATGYVSTPQIAHLAAWRRLRAAALDPRTGEPLQNVRFTLDAACYADYAAALLPEIGRYAQVALDYLFRGELKLSLPSGSKSLLVRVAETPLGTGTLTVLIEQPEGTRRVVQTQATLPTRVGGTLATVTLSDSDLSDAHRLVVLFRGHDRQSEPIVTSAELALPKASEAKPEPKSEPATDTKTEE
jgi:hypothetical protein